jgi:hypothetical protein
MTPEQQKRAEDYIRERWPRKGPCLIPHKSAATKDSMLLTCHENDFCLCDMRESYAAGYSAHCEETKGLIEALEIVSECGNCGGCKGGARNALRAYREGMK